LRAVFSSELSRAVFLSYASQDVEAAQSADGAAFQIAEVYALRNEAKSTFEWLDRAWGARTILNAHAGIKF
jgi:hypothetical protein